MKMMLKIIICVAFVTTTLIAAKAQPRTCLPTIVKVPCRNMGDGRTLIDSLYLPDGFDQKNSRYTIVHTRPTSMEGEWANRVCTIKLQ